VGVADVAATLELQGAGIRLRPRAQPLWLRPDTAAVPVLHVDADWPQPTAFSPAQAAAVVRQLLALAPLGNRRVVQLDFEVRRSQRGFLRAVVVEARRQLPPGVAMSVTALASWCEGDDWLQGLPADEWVPMAFRMAAGDAAIRKALARRGRFASAHCQQAIGTASDELPVPVQARRHYYFSPRPWSTETWLQARASTPP
jgi:hypothetical protein